MLGPQFGLRAMDGNVVVSDRQVWAYFQIPTVTYRFLDESQQQALVRSVATAFTGLADTDLHLLAVPEPVDLQRWAAALTADLSRAAPGWSELVASQRQHLAATQLYQKAVYLGVCLGNRQPPSTASRARRWVESALGLDDWAVEPSELSHWQRRSGAIARLLTEGALAGTPASAAQMLWLIRRGFHRGLDGPPPFASPGKRWGAGELVMLTEGVITHHRRHVILDQPSGTACTATLALARFPDGMRLPGAEWLALADRLDFPVEVSMRLKLLRSSDAAREVRRKVAELSDQGRHIADTGAELPRMLADQTEQALALDHALTKQRVPLAVTWPRLVVSAPDTETLAHRVHRVTELYRDLGIETAWPSGDQLDLFTEALPGGAVRTPVYAQWQPVTTVAGGMVQSATAVGDGTGPYIGTAGLHNAAPVHLDPLAAAARNRPTVLSITGEPGAGKTFAAQLLTYQLAMRGTWTLLIDPKGEAGGLADLPGLGASQVLELSGDEAGLLDPFALADNPEEGAMLALEVLRLVLPPGMGFEREGALLTLCKEVAASDVPSLHKVVEAAAEATEPGLGLLAGLLRAVEDYPLAKLCFAREQARVVQPDDHLTILQIAGLNMPEPGLTREEQGWHERLSVAVMFLVADFAKRLAQGRDRHQPKAIVLDEAWMLTGSAQGQALIPALARMGRSRNTAVIMVSQNAGDFTDERIRNCVAVKLAFRSSSQSEVDDVLDLLEVPVTADHRTAIQTLRNGQCVLSDLDGRTEVVQIDPITDDLKAAFDTTPDGTQAGAQR